MEIELHDKGMDKTAKQTSQQTVVSKGRSFSRNSAAMGEQHTHRESVETLGETSTLASLQLQ